MITEKMKQCLADLEAVKVQRHEKREQLTLTESVQTSALAAVTVATAAKAKRQRDYDNARTLDQLEASTSALSAATNQDVIAARDAQAAAKAQAHAADELHQAEADVRSAARHVFDAELTELALKVTVARAAYLKFGEQLSDLAVVDYFNTNERPVIPASVLAALKGLPRADDRDVPLNILRGGNGVHGTETRAQRLAELSA